MTPVLGPGEYHGAVEASFALPGVEAAITRRAKGSRVGPHSHSRSSFIALIEGSHCWSGDDGSIHWSIPGVWYFRPAHYRHSHAECPTDIRSVGFHFDSEIARSLELPETPIQFDGPEARRITELALRSLSEKSPASEHWLKGVFHELLGHFAEAARNGASASCPAWLETARITLDESFRETAGLAQLAQRVSVHPSHLAREFRRHFGVSVGEYIRDRRLEWAYRRIRSDMSKIAEIAAQAGFADHAHFCRVFKAHYGQTPSELRSGSIR